MRKFILEYFPVSSNYKIKDIVKSINHLYSQSVIICPSFGCFNYIIDNEKIIIPCIWNDINEFIECGFKFYKKRNEYVYFFNRNQSYCIKCNFNLINIIGICNNCYSNSKDSFTNNWYNIFFNNSISKKMISQKYCEVELDIKEPMIIKTNNNNEINITKTIIFMDEINKKWNNNLFLTIYFIDKDVNDIEKIFIYNQI